MAPLLSQLKYVNYFKEATESSFRDHDLVSWALCFGQKQQVF